MRAVRLTRRAAGVVASVALWTSSAAGQTRFAWPDTAVDVSTYTTIEECQAAVSRVRQGMASRQEIVSGIWRDTMPPDPLEWREPLPAPVGETTRRCLARFAAVDSVPLTHFSVLVPLYLQAGWDAKATALVDRRLAAIAPDTKTAANELAAVIDTVITISWQQARFSGPRVQSLGELAQEFALEYLPRVPDRVKRLQTYMKLMFQSSSGDTVRVQRILARMLAITDSLTERERETLQEWKLLAIDGLAVGEGENFEQQLYAILNTKFAGRAFLDSLRRSTAAFVAMKRDNWARATGHSPQSLGIPIGERAPALEADIWLGRGDSIAPRPSPERVSLLVFLTEPACGGNTVCASKLFPVRRLAERFPALEITVVAQTHGYFMYLKDSITPAREAALTKQWLESYGVNAPLAMTSTDYWRLPDPDGRRIQRDVSNRTNYSFGKSWSVSNNAMIFLIDDDGIIVDAGYLNRSSEEELGGLIEVLLERQVAGTR